CRWLVIVAKVNLVTGTQDSAPARRQRWTWCAANVEAQQQHRDQIRWAGPTFIISLLPLTLAILPC
ncbi:MAG: hypothetical protein M5R42_03465, partial [Rhodocyclaceae bacterium]|nr:hypothetical protein [Rhodocyclaceae bacterium]